MLPGPGDIVARRYRVESQIGAGGFAVVYLATDLDHGTSVALKVLRRPEAGYDRETTLRFEREAAVLKSLRHPNVVRLLDHGGGDLLFLVFQMVGGDDLAELLRNGPLEVEKVITILRQLLKALAAAHDAGVLHRDVKPENIRVISDGPQLHVKLLDFGIARPSDDGSPTITATGELLGTPRYMSPEQLTNRPLGPASDVYPAGMVGLEMLLGREAMHGNRWVDQLDRLRTGHVFALPGIEQHGVHLMYVLNRMTAREEETRYQTAHAALSALDAMPTVVSPRIVAKAPSRVSRRLLVGAGVALLAVVTMVLPEDPEPVPSVPVSNVKALMTPDPPPPSPEPEQPDVGEPKRAPEYGSSGCNLEPIDFDGLPTYRPRNYDPHRAYPLVVLLRDRHMTPDAWLAGSGFPALADEHGFVLIAPRPGTYRPWSGKLDESIDEIQRDVSRTLAAACIDPGQIFALAHGHGFAPASRLACQPWIRGMATYANSSRKDVCEAYQGPFLLLHPTMSRHQRVDDSTDRDPRCEADRGKTFVARKRARRTRLGLTETTPDRWSVPGAECETFSGVHDFVACTYDGGRHWPGLPRERLLGGMSENFGTEPAECDGPEPVKFKPAPLIWRFFSELKPGDRETATAALTAQPRRRVAPR